MILFNTSFPDRVNTSNVHLIMCMPHLHAHVDDVDRQEVLHNIDSEADHDEEGAGSSAESLAESMQLDSLFDPGYDYYSPNDAYVDESENLDVQPCNDTNAERPVQGSSVSGSGAPRGGSPGTNNSQQRRTKRRNRKRYRPYGNVTVSRVAI